MNAIKKPSEIPKSSAGADGAVILYEGSEGRLFARRLPDIKRIVETPGQWRSLKFTSILAGAWVAMQDKDPDKIIQWNKAAAFYKKWYPTTAPYGQRMRYRLSGVYWDGRILFMRCNNIAYYSGLSVLRWSAPTLKGKIPQPAAPILRFDNVKKTVVVKCHRPELPDDIKEAVIQVFACVYFLWGGGAFLVGCIDAKSPTLEIRFSKFPARKRFAHTHTLAFGQIYKARVRVWTYLVVTQGEKFGALDSPPSEFAILDIPINPRGKSRTDKIKKRYYKYVMLYRKNSR